MTTNTRPSALRVIVAIDSTFILLDVLETLKDLGFTSVRGVSSPKHALAVLWAEGCDAIILGVEHTSPGFSMLVNEIERLQVPVLVVANGLIDSGAARLKRMEAVNVPFDSASLATAIERIVRTDAMLVAAN